MNGFLQASWKLLVIRGVIGIVFGIMAMAWPISTILVLVLLWGAFVLVDGLSMLVEAFSGPSTNRLFLIVMGALAVVAGLYALVRPGVSAASITWVLGIWLIVRALFELIGAFGPQGATSRWLLVLSAAFSGVLGILFVVKPGRSAIGIAVGLGILAVAWGLAQLVAGLVLRKEITEAISGTPAAG